MSDCPWICPEMSACGKLSGIESDSVRMTCNLGETRKLGFLRMRDDLLTMKGEGCSLGDAARERFLFWYSDLQVDARHKFAVVEEIAPANSRGSWPCDNQRKLEALNSLEDSAKREFPIAVGSNIRAGLQRMQ